MYSTDCLRERTYFNHQRPSIVSWYLILSVPFCWRSRLIRFHYFDHPWYFFFHILIIHTYTCIISIIRIDAEINSKPMILIMGPTGTGKTTAIKYLLGLESSAIPRIPIGKTGRSVGNWVHKSSLLDIREWKRLNLLLVRPFCAVFEPPQ